MDNNNISKVILKAIKFKDKKVNKNYTQDVKDSNQQVIRKLKSR
jgi:hypothetical protein